MTLGPYDASLNRLAMPRHETAAPRPTVPSRSAAIGGTPADLTVEPAAYNPFGPGRRLTEPGSTGPFLPPTLLPPEASAARDRAWHLRTSWALQRARPALVALQQMLGSPKVAAATRTEACQAFLQKYADVPAVLREFLLPARAAQSPGVRLVEALARDPTQAHQKAFASQMADLLRHLEALVPALQHDDCQTRLLPVLDATAEAMLRFDATAQAHAETLPQSLVRGTLFDEPLTTLMRIGAPLHRARWGDSDLLFLCEDAAKPVGDAVALAHALLAPAGSQRLTMDALRGRFPELHRGILVLGLETAVATLAARLGLRLDLLEHHAPQDAAPLIMAAAHQAEAAAAHASPRRRGHLGLFATQMRNLLDLDDAERLGKLRELY